MNSLRELLREHQRATDCSDDRMVGILSDYLERLDKVCIGCWRQPLLDFIVENLEQGPPGIMPTKESQAMKIEYHQPIDGAMYMQLTLTPVSVVCEFNASNEFTVIEVDGADRPILRSFSQPEDKTVEQCWEECLLLGHTELLALWEAHRFQLEVEARAQGYLDELITKGEELDRLIADIDVKDMTSARADRLKEALDALCAALDDLDGVIEGEDD